MFFTFEGGEAVGKSTQIALLGQALAGEGYRVLTTREPGGTPVGDAIRAVLLSKQYEGMSAACEALLYAASRAQHVAGVIDPALAEGAIVLCDRYLDSSLAYQGYGRGLDVAWLRSINRPAQEAAPRRTYLLDMPPKAAFARKGNARLDRLESEGEGFHRRVYEGFLALAAAEPERILRIDAARPAQAVAQDILRDALALLRQCDGAHQRKD